jgi:hypothetical protein
MNHNESGTVAIGAPGSAMRRITKPAEPQTEPPSRYDVSTDTPWGTAQSATYYMEGVIFYSTASHGGFHLSKTALRRVPDYLQTADKYAPGTAGWYEEDCASAIVVVCFPELFRMEWRENAIQTMQHTYPEQWARFCQAQ